MRPCGWWNSCCNSTGIVQITLCSVSLAFIKWGWPLLFCMEFGSPTFMWHILCFQSVFICYRNTLSFFFCILGLFCILLLVFHVFLEPSRHFKFWKWNVIFVMVFSLPLSYILWDFCIWNMLNCCNLQTLCYKSVRNCARCKCKCQSLCEHFITASCMATSKCCWRHSIDTCDAAFSVACLCHTGQSMSGTLPLALLWRVSTLRMFLCQWHTLHPLPLCLEIRVRK
jgi:hypothetical protein